MLVSAVNHICFVKETLFHFAFSTRNNICRQNHFKLKTSFREQYWISQQLFKVMRNYLYCCNNHVFLSLPTGYFPNAEHFSHSRVIVTANNKRQHITSCLNSITFKNATFSSTPIIILSKTSARISQGKLFLIKFN